MNVLVPIDFSDVTGAVLDQAARLVKAAGGKVWLLHVASEDPYFVGYAVGPAHVRDNAAKEVRQEHQQLSRIAGGLEEQGIATTALLVSGTAGEKIVEEARRIGVEMIVMGSHGRGAMFHLLAGSVCQGVLKHAPCPVLIVPAMKK